jgi:hypothetical protein
LDDWRIDLAGIFRSALSDLDALVEFAAGCRKNVAAEFVSGVIAVGAGPECLAAQRGSLVGLDRCVRGACCVGLVWLANEIGLATGWWAPIEGVNRAVGGGYWLLANFVPGYFLFRYPAKLMVLVSLVVALLAGWAWSRAEARQLQRILLSLAGLVVSVLLVSCFFPWERLGGWLAGDELFGPFDVFVFQGLFWLGGAQALVAALIGWVMLAAQVFACGLCPGNRFGAGELLVVTRFKGRCPEAVGRRCELFELAAFLAHWNTTE